MCASISLGNFNVNLPLRAFSTCTIKIAPKYVGGLTQSRKDLFVKSL